MGAGLAGAVLARELADRAEMPFVGSLCAGAAAALCGVIDKAMLQRALRQELAHLGEAVVYKNSQRAPQALQPVPAQPPRAGGGGRP